MLSPTIRSDYNMPKLMREHCHRIAALCSFILLFTGLFAFGHPTVLSAAPLPKAPLLKPAGSLAPDSIVTDTVPASNNIVDLVLGPPGVWAATGGGVSSFSTTDRSWRGFSDSIVSDHEIPAVEVFGDQIWVSTSHAEVVQEQSVPHGDGIFMSSNGGLSWLSVSPDSGQASGPFMLAYDLASIRDMVFAACFAGGLVMTVDGGTKWTNIFPSAFAKDDWINKRFESLNNRFFSCVADTAVPESLSLIAGSALGINKFVYLDSTLKVTGFNFRKIYLDGPSLYAASERGLSLSPNHTGIWRSSGLWSTFYFQGNDFPTNFVSTFAAHGDTIIVGIDSTPGTKGAGLAITVDSGAHWTSSKPDRAMGLNQRAVSIVSAAGAWWVACAQGGLIRSADQGVTWDSIEVTDFLPEDTSRLLTRVNALLAVTKSDTTKLYAGTDSGIVVYTVPDGEWPVGATILQVGFPAEKLGLRVTGLAYQPLADSSAIWSFNRPLAVDTTRNGYAVSRDGGQTWAVSSRKVCPNDAAFFDKVFYLASDSGLARGFLPRIDTTDYLPNLNAYRTKPPARSVALQIGPDSVGNPSISAIWVGTDSGLVFTTNSGSQWGVIWSNPNRHEFDLNYHVNWLPVDTSTHEFPSLSGDFVTALAIQTYAGNRIYWGATQTTSSSQRSGISRSIDGGLNWRMVIPSCADDSCRSGQVNAWNFAFDGPNVWIAASQGLYHSPDVGSTWERINRFVDPTSGAVIDSTTELYGVCVVGDELWIGSANGLAVIDKTDHSVISVRRKFKQISGDIPSGKGGTYATPVPYSPRFFDGVRIHFTPPVSGAVKVTIYDFANNTVRTFADNSVREAGIQYDETIVWDGRNGKGDLVATGAYFFVVEYANGETHWGKIVVIP